MLPLVSVIIPNYNHAEYLEERINSVLNQTFDNFEVILLDDCSSDESCQIIESFRVNPKISHIVLNDVNSGSPFIQWHKGIQLAKGDLIWIAESDDFCENNFLFSCVQQFEVVNDLSIAYTKSTIVNKGGEPTKFLGYSTYPNEKLNTDFSHSFIKEGNKFIHNYLIERNLIPNASSVVFKKSIYQNSIKNPVEMKLFGDWFIWIELLKNGKISYINESFNFFRNHNNTARKKNDGTYDSYFDLITLGKSICNFQRDSKNKVFQSLLYKFQKYFLDNQNISLKQKTTLLWKLSTIQPLALLYVLKHKLRN